jgi:hypothetical protein
MIDKGNAQTALVIEAAINVRPTIILRYWDLKLRI